MSSLGIEPRPQSGAAEVWRLQLGSPEVEPLLARAHAALTPGERERSGRIRAGLARSEFLAARGILRLLLGAVVKRPADELEFELGAQGKPSLVDGAGVEFNVAHARGFVLVALSFDGPVGVDVEPVDRAVETGELAQAHFHPAEIARIVAEHDEARRTALFFRCWTRKEAVVKADGRGLQLPLEEFCVLEAGDEAETQVTLPGAGRLWVRDLVLGAGYAGALSVSKREIFVSMRDFMDSASQADR